MMKSLYFLPLFLFACSQGCAKNYPAPPPPITHDKSEIVVQDAGSKLTEYKNSYFSFSIANSWSQQQLDNKNSIVYFTDTTQAGSAWLVSKEDFKGTLDQFALLSTRAAKETGLNVLSSSKIDINNVKFFTLLMSKEGSLFWMWLTVRKDMAFTFGCKTQDIPENKSAEVCAPIAESIIFHGN